MNNNINPALEKYTELIIKKIKEVDASEWQKPWFTPTFIGVPQNLSGRPYSNLNKVLLYAVCDENKYSTPVFITFHQAQERNIRILKGARAFPITFYDLYITEIISGNKVTKEFYHSLSDEEKAHYKVKPLQKFYSVFNLEQTNYSEKFPEEWAKLQQRFQTQLNIESDGYHNQLIDKVIKEQSWICPIELKQQDRAFYNRKSDSIVRPTYEQFFKKESFYFTALHEMAHSTGHSSRLNRTFGEFFGDSQYAKEELVAELSSAVAGRDLGIAVLPQKENAQYLKSWLSQISDDPRYLMSILNDVNKSTNMIESTIGVDSYKDNNTKLEILNKTQIQLHDNAQRILGSLEQQGIATKEAMNRPEYIEAIGKVNEAKQLWEKEKERILQLKKDIVETCTRYRNLGYDSIAHAIETHVPYYTRITEPGISINYKVENIELPITQIKTLHTDMILSGSPSSLNIDFNNPRINDKVTGATENLQTNGISLFDQPADSIKKLFSGKRVELPNNSGKLNPVILCKSPLGWSITISKQLQNTVESSASI